MKGFSRGRRLGAMLVSALALAGVGIAVPVLGAASAASPESVGPVIFLNRHGGPIGCSVEVTGWRDPSWVYTKSMTRNSCDGTLQLPVGASKLDVKINSLSYELKGSILDVKDGWAYCFLVEAGGKIVYTNSSEAGGACNGH